MKKLTILLTLYLGLFSCSKEKSTQNNIKGSWRYTRVVVAYNNGNPYATGDFGWSSVEYKNTEAVIHVAKDPMSYSVVGQDSLYINDISRTATLEFMSNKNDGFNLKVIGDNEDSTIQWIEYHYRK